MELHCLPSETPTTASSCSTDPLYDNCPPFAQRGRAREKEMESGVVCPAVTRLPGPCSSLPGLAPAVVEVSTLVGGERGSGAWPDHSYCSWRGGLGIQDWEAELSPGINRSGGGERGGEQGGSWGQEGRFHLNQSPSPTQSEEHSSALSLYDNLSYAITPNSVQEVFDVETSFQEHLQEHIYQVWAPEQIQGLWEGEQDQNSDQEKMHEMEPELDSGADLMSPPKQHLTASSLQLSQTGCQVTWPSPKAQHPEQPTLNNRVPPPVPQADPSASALRSLLTSLQQQIVRQREEYEEKIISLEQRNEELQVKVVRLKTNLTQQQQWYQVVQAKITESERIRAAAELRNAKLQREMEQFFDNFGELNHEAKKTEYIVKSF
ncbi:uncharacterized protein LOC113144109 isoform X2 [Mastacembelus armatus]|uniref:uncharacterized protein LOC113144109 isoform X2 n=1 Tax=Mastacembelus armatus TaxID=205130 RepID=UPI000E462BD2|nr:uncharacterized protein LOC113144109 isoform X2 [Mastacembelus armatus]